MANSGGGLPDGKGHALRGALLVHGVAHRWLPYLRSREICSLLTSSRVMREVAEEPSVWEEIARSWHFMNLDLYPAVAGSVCPATPSSGTKLCGLSPASVDPLPWRRFCHQQEKLWHAWRGAPTPLRLDVRQELRHQRLSDLDVLLVEFLAGEEALVFGHSNGAVSTWELYQTEADGASPGVDPAPAGDPLSFFPSPSSGSGSRPAAPAAGRETPSKSGASRLQARILGVFQTSRKYDVHDLAVWPAASAQPSSLLFGHKVQLAAAIGPTAFIWESGDGDVAEAVASDDWSPSVHARPTSALKSWRFRGALRHAELLASEHHIVWTVRLSGVLHGACCHAVTVGEDGVLRGWRLEERYGSDALCLWQHPVGDARQVVTAVLSLDLPCPAVAAVARADRRSLELVGMEAGEVVRTVHNVWPAVGESLPQTAAFDTSRLLALFSSITDRGSGAVTCFDLCAVASAHGEAELCYEQAAPPSAPRMAKASTALAGTSRVLRLVLPVPAADACLAVVLEQSAKGSLEVLEVWERFVSLGEVPGSARYRGRVPRTAANPRLVAVGGRRLALLDPRAFLHSGELRLLEWRPVEAPDPQEGRGSGSSARCSSRRAEVVGPRSGQSLVGCECCRGVARLLGIAAR